MLPSEFKCPITGRTHSIVYKDQNKAKLIKYCHDFANYFKTHPKSYRYIAIDTEGKINIADINDVFVIQFAECFVNNKNLFDYRISNYSKIQETIDLQDGFIIFDPDDDVKRALRLIFSNYFVYTIFFDISRDVLGLHKIGIPVNGKPDQTGKVINHTVIDTQLRPQTPPLSSYISLKYVINHINFPCKEAAAAKAQLEVKSSVDFSKLIYENLGKSDSDIIPQYVGFLQYISNDIAFTALSLLVYINVCGTIRSMQKLQAEQLTKLWKEEREIGVNFGAILLVKSVKFSTETFRHPEKNLYKTYIDAERLIKYYSAIKDFKKDFLFTKEELIEFRDIAKEWINGDKSREFPNAYDLKLDLYKYRITGKLQKDFTNIWNDIKKKSPHTIENSWFDICAEIHPDLYDFICACEVLTDDEMTQECKDLHDAIINGKVDQHINEF